MQRSAKAVKKLIAGAVTVAVLATLFVASEPIHGQATTAAPAAAHKIGLIDMAEVFKEYEKFKTAREALQAEIEKSEGVAKAMIDEMKQINDQATTSDFKQDSPQYKELEQRMITKKSELEAYRASQQRDFLRKESEIYKQVYLETQDMVEKYAKYFKYTLVMRFNRQSVEDAANPQEVIQSMNRQVVYHEATDDITDAVLQQLNTQYAKAKQSASAR
jgi:Skp family chaperone for outer membrane proteins